MDTIFIHDLATESIIGIFPEEKLAPQPLIISVTLGTDFTLAAQTDQIEHALDYGVIATRIDTFVRETRVALLETLAARICDMLFAEFAVLDIELRITKPNAIALTPQVGVSVKRSKDQSGF